MILEPSDIHLERVKPGAMRLTREADGHVHRKIVPDLIIAQVLEGCYELVAGEQRAEITSGACLITHPAIALSFTHRVDPRTGIFRSRWVHLGATCHGGIDLFSLIEAPLFLPRERCGPVDAIFPELLSHATSTDTQGAFATSACAFRLMRWVWELSAPSPHAHLLHQHAGWIRPLLAYLREHLAHHPSGSELASRAGLSRSTFYPLFERCTGFAPRKYVEELRLRRATELLRRDLALHEIAEALGYRNPFHFSRAFKRRMGIAPSAYRASAAGEMGEVGPGPGGMEPPHPR